jgi:hypothetical protein
MAIEVEGPDGAVIEFPDDTLPDVIKGAMAKRYGGGQQTASLAPHDRMEFTGAGAKGMTLPERDPKHAGPKLLEEGLLLSAWEDPDGSRSLGAGKITKPIVEGIRNALPAAARYQSFDPQSTDDVIKAVVPPATVMGPGSVGGLGWAARPMAGKPPPAMSPDGKPVHRVPTEELRANAKAAYKRGDEAGVIFTPQGVSRVVDDAIGDMAEFGYHPRLHPRIDIALDELGKVAQGNVTMKGMDTLRKITGAAGKSQDDTERMLAGVIIDKIDDLMLSPRAGEVLTGNNPQAAAAYKEARTLWSQMRKTQHIEKALDKAELRAASTGSGGNEHNAIRQNLRRLLDSERTARAFSDAERKAIEDVVRGTKPLNTLRLVGKLSPETGGLMTAIAATMGAAGVSLNPLVAIPPVIGFVSKRLADRGMHKAVERLEAMVSSGQPAKVAVNWGDMVTKYHSGGTSQAALRISAMALARQLAKETGEDEKAITQSLMDSVNDA